MSIVREFAGSKVGSGLILAGALALLAMLSGVASLPANDARQEQRIGNVEGKVEKLEKNEIRHEAKLDQVLDAVKEIKDDVKQIRRER